MSVKIKAIARKNPQDLTAASKYYATTATNDVVSVDQLCELISDGSTVRQADIYAVIIGLVNAIQGELTEGRTVRLGKLGSFSIGINSDSAATTEEVKATLIKNARVRYRPSKEFKQMLNQLSYQKVAS